MSSKNSNNPLVSIMMVTYNRADLIVEAIESVLAQSYQNWELLILDDGSTDSTASVVGSFAERDTRIKYLPAPQNLGITRNRNRGFPFVHGEYIAVLDSDDVWCSVNKIERQVDYMGAHSECAVLGTSANIIDEHSKKIGVLIYTTDDTVLRKNALLRNPFIHSSVLIRKSMLADNQYDATVPIWEDYDLFLRIGKLGKFANLSEPLTCYRVHSGNISKEKKLHGAKVHLNIIKKYRASYPRYWLAVIKGYMRITRAFLL